MAKRTCGVQGCDNPYRSAGLCQAHDQRQRRLGDVRADIPLRTRRSPQLPGPCEVADCERRRKTRGFCGGHYERWKRFGDPQEHIPILDQSGTPTDPCKIDKCGKMPTAGGLCGMHRSRRLRTGTVQPRIITEDILEARREALRAYQRQWKAAEYLRSGEIVRQRHRAWIAAHPERYAVYNARSQKQRGAAAVVSFTAASAAAKWAYWAGLCWICGSKATSWDHVKPLSRGGWHMLSNLRPACRSCNSRKHAKWPYSTSTRKAA